MRFSLTTRLCLAQAKRVQSLHRAPRAALVNLAIDAGVQ
jgi:hypothetical protein